jgi:hypothetical protein
MAPNMQASDPTMTPIPSTPAVGAAIVGLPRRWERRLPSSASR